MEGLRRATTRVVAHAMIGAVVVLGAVAAPANGATGIVSRGAAWHGQFDAQSTNKLKLNLPGGTHAGDVLVATLGLFGSATATAQPTLTAPPGWTLASRTEYGATSALAVYTHVLAAGESSWTWQTDVKVGGVAFVAAFAGVDQSKPVDSSAGQTATATSAISTPSVSTAMGGEALLASYYGFQLNGKAAKWTPPSGMAELGDAVTGKGVATSALDYVLQPAAGPTGAKTATATPPQEYEIATLTTLRPQTTGTPPAISAVAAGSLTPSGATVTWSTEQASDSQVEYGPTSTYGFSTVVNPAAVTAHAQTFGGLQGNTTYHYRVKSRNASGALAASSDQTFTTPVAASGPIPLIVDTDIWSSADDVGALASAFALQINGTANMIAIGVDTRLSRPEVASNSWKCVAALAAYYGFGSVPIGTDSPNDGTDTNTPDFVGPCATLAPASTPIPGSAVSVYRQALAAQPDGSVVVVGIGYEENLSALLHSQPDAFSPLDGYHLIAQKVKALVLMGGGYPSRAGENNLIGNPGAAQDVAASWPTKVVWSGYEVGDAIHTGQTISSVQPVDSPVRVAYEAFVGPNNWIYSYDLTAVYHALRPEDTLLTEVGPGTNVVDSSGGNAFTIGPGDQYYLKLGSATSLDASIEQLLDVVPADTTAPLITDVAANPTSTGAIITWSTNEPSASQIEYGLTTEYGSSTTLDSSKVTSHSQTISGLTPSLTYHYRVRSSDAAGNTSVSEDLTFSPASGGASGPGGPNDNFDTNTLDPSRWTATPNGSTVAAANQELEITHPAGSWTKGMLESAPYEQAGRSVRLHVIRPANEAKSTQSGFGETSVTLWVDSTHFAEFFFASGSLTAWSDNGSSSGEVNLTPSWPAYNPATMQWLRFRESGGTLYFDYAGGSTSPEAWTTLASVADPFPMGAVKLRIVAGSNVSVTDTAKFDDVSTA
jgi:hypothetical protein